MKRLRIILLSFIISIPLFSQVNITTFAGGLYLGLSKYDFAEKWKGRYEVEGKGKVSLTKFEFLGLEHALLTFKQGKLVRAEFYTNEGDIRNMTSNEAMELYKRSEKISVSRCENLYNIISSKYGTATILEHNKRTWIDSNNGYKLSIEYSYTYYNHYQSVMNGSLYEVMTRASVIYELDNSSSSYYEF